MVRIKIHENSKSCIRKGKKTSRFVRINLDYDSGNIVCVVDTLKVPVRKPRLIRAKKNHPRYARHVAMKDC